MMIKSYVPMSVGLCFLVFFSGFGVAISRADDPDRMPSAVSVIQKHAQASGGAEKFKTISTLRMKGRLKIESMGINGNIEVLQSIPGKSVTTAEIPNMGSQVQGSNGEMGWEVSTMMGARLLEEKELDRLRQDSNFQSVYDPEKFYKSMEVVGTAEFNDNKCYKLKLVKKNDMETTEYYSLDTGLQVGSESKIYTQMGELPIKSLVSEYKEFGGVKMPCKIELHTNGMVQQIIFDSIEINPELDPKTFDAPAEIQALIDESKK